jgi:hypothetical protein
MCVCDSFWKWEIGPTLLLPPLKRAAAGNLLKIVVLLRT